MCRDELTDLEIASLLDNDKVVELFVDFSERLQWRCRRPGLLQPPNARVVSDSQGEKGFSGTDMTQKAYGSASYQQTSDDSLLNINDSQVCLQVLSLRPRERSALLTRVMA